MPAVGVAVACVGAGASADRHVRRTTNATAIAESPGATVGVGHVRHGDTSPRQGACSARSGAIALRTTVAGWNAETGSARLETSGADVAAGIGGGVALPGLGGLNGAVPVDTTTGYAFGATLLHRPTREIANVPVASRRATDRHRTGRTPSSAVSDRGAVNAGAETQMLSRRADRTPSSPSCCPARSDARDPTHTASADSGLARPRAGTSRLRPAAARSGDGAAYRRTGAARPHGRTVGPRGPPSAHAGIRANGSSN